MKLEFDLCPTFLVGMSVKVMIFTQPLDHIGSKVYWRMLIE